MESYTLPIHFGNFEGKHEIDSNSFVVFLEAYKEIAKQFGLHLDIQVGVPTEGGWKTKLGLAISFVGLSPITMLFTGYSADDLAKKGREASIDLINKYITTPTASFSVAPPKECIRQKNNIYKQFLKDPCIHSFRLGGIDAIPRGNFHLYLQEEPEEIDLYLGETSITVHSPDWKGKRSWKGQIDVLDEKERSFDFNKNLTGKFWEQVELDRLTLHTEDVMRVQLVERPAHKVKFLVIRVLSYNNSQIDAPLAEIDISKFAAVSGIKAEQSSQAQANLFPT
jgi:hypothetical protein